MKPELDDALCRDFPLLYRNRYTNPATSCMTYGFPGDGWEPLIRRLSEKLERAIAALPEERREECCAAQCKEKFGTLRFYLDGSTDEMEAWIDEAEDESAVTCEECGADGVLRSGGWVRTLCDVHHYEQLVAQAKVLPSATNAEKRQQRADWAFGQMACTKQYRDASPEKLDELRLMARRAAGCE